MFSDFSSVQAIAYRILMNGVRNNKCSHAYLINTNGYNKGFDFARAFAKVLLCPNNSDNCTCNECLSVDNDVCPDLKIINCDGLWIKKEQMDDLQAEFSMKSVSSNRKVYIINGAHNLNASASNSILKFLEEPEEGIVAILVTDNIYNVLGTIVSRCQVINLNNNETYSDSMIDNIANKLYDESDKIDEFVNSPESFSKVHNIIDFIKFLDNNRLDTILYINDVWNKLIQKDDYIFAFDIMLMFYNDVISYKLNSSILLTDYRDDITKFSSYDLSYIMKCINLIIELKNRIYSNVNIGLLMDKLIIGMEALR
jgi:DNA polymerase-3 subunit delta'